MENSLYRKLKGLGKYGLHTLKKCPRRFFNCFIIIFCFNCSSTYGQGNFLSIETNGQLLVKKKHFITTNISLDFKDDMLKSEFIGILKRNGISSTLHTPTSLCNNKNINQVNFFISENERFDSTYLPQISTIWPCIKFNNKIKIRELKGKTYVKVRICLADFILNPGSYYLKYIFVNSNEEEKCIFSNIVLLDIK